VDAKTFVLKETTVPITFYNNNTCLLEENSSCEICSKTQLQSTNANETSSVESEDFDYPNLQPIKIEAEIGRKRSILCAIVDRNAL